MCIVSRVGSGCRPNTRQQYRNTTSRDYGNEQHGNADRDDDYLTGDDRDSDRHTQQPIANYDYDARNNGYSGNQHDNSSFWRDFTGNQSWNAEHYSGHTGHLWNHRADGNADNYSVGHGC